MTCERTAWSITERASNNFLLSIGLRITFVLLLLLLFWRIGQIHFTFLLASCPADHLLWNFNYAFALALPFGAFLGSASRFAWAILGVGQTLWLIYIGQIWQYWWSSATWHQTLSNLDVFLEGFDKFLSLKTCQILRIHHISDHAIFRQNIIWKITNSFWERTWWQGTLWSNAWTSVVEGFGPRAVSRFLWSPIPSEAAVISPINWSWDCNGSSWAHNLVHWPDASDAAITQDATKPSSSALSGTTSSSWLP